MISCFRRHTGCPIKERHQTIAGRFSSKVRKIDNSGGYNGIIDIMI